MPLIAQTTAAPCNSPRPPLGLVSPFAGTDLADDDARSSAKASRTANTSPYSRHAEVAEDSASSRQLITTPAAAQAGANIVVSIERQLTTAQAAQSSTAASSNCRQPLSGLTEPEPATKFSRLSPTFRSIAIRLRDLGHGQWRLQNFCSDAVASDFIRMQKRINAGRLRLARSARRVRDFFLKVGHVATSTPARSSTTRRRLTLRAERRKRGTVDRHHRRSARGAFRLNVVVPPHGGAAPASA